MITRMEQTKLFTFQDLERLEKIIREAPSNVTFKIKDYGDNNRYTLCIENIQKNKSFQQEGKKYDLNAKQDCWNEPVQEEKIVSSQVQQINSIGLYFIDSHYGLQQEEYKPLIEHKPLVEHKPEIFHTFKAKETVEKSANLKHKTEDKNCIKNILNSYSKFISIYGEQHIMQAIMQNVQPDVVIENAEDVMDVEDIMVVEDAEEEEDLEDVYNTENAQVAKDVEKQIDFNQITRLQNKLIRVSKDCKISKTSRQSKCVIRTSQNKQLNKFYQSINNYQYQYRDDKKAIKVSYNRDSLIKLCKNKYGLCSFVYWLKYLADYCLDRFSAIKDKKYHRQAARHTLSSIENNQLSTLTYKVNIVKQIHVDEYVPKPPQIWQEQEMEQEQEQEQIKHPYKQSFEIHLLEDYTNGNLGYDDLSNELVLLGQSMSTHSRS